MSQNIVLFYVIFFKNFGRFKSNVSLDLTSSLLAVASKVYLTDQNNNIISTIPVSSLNGYLLTLNAQQIQDLKNHLLCLNVDLTNLTKLKGCL